jgi:hypothetical protein
MTALLPGLVTGGGSGGGGSGVRRYDVQRDEWQAGGETGGDTEESTLAAFEALAAVSGVDGEAGEEGGDVEALARDAEAAFDRLATSLIASGLGALTASVAGEPQEFTCREATSLVGAGGGLGCAVPHRGSRDKKEGMSWEARLVVLGNSLSPIFVASVLQTCVSCLKDHPAVAQAAEDGGGRGGRKKGKGGRGVAQAAVNADGSAGCPTGLWRVVDVLVRSLCVPVRTCPDLIATALAHSQLAVVEGAILYCRDLPEREILRIMQVRGGGGGGVVWFVFFEGGRGSGTGGGNRARTVCVEVRRSSLSSVCEKTGNASHVLPCPATCLPSRAHHSHHTPYTKCNIGS